MLFVFFTCIYSIRDLYTLNCQEGQRINLYTMRCTEGCPDDQFMLFENTERGFSCVASCPDPLLSFENKCYPTGTNVGNAQDRCLQSLFFDYESCEEVANTKAVDFYQRDRGWNNIVNNATNNPGTEFVNSIQYFRSFDIIMDDTIQQEFSFSSILTFILTRFDFNGTFIGFKELTVDITQCHEKNDVALVWRYFGTNFYSKCNFNLPVYNDSVPSEFFNIYFLDNNELKDVPVLIRNHGNNNMPDSGNYQLFKRFFMKSVSNGRIITPNNVTIQFTIDPTNAKRLKVPLLILNYITPTGTVANYSNIAFENASPPMYSFYYSIVYTRDLKSFWKSSMIVLIIFLVLALILWVVRSVIYAKHHKDDGTTIPYFFALFCGSIGTALTIVTFIVTFFLIFVFYKFQKQGYFSLPPEKEFWFISVIVWISFFLMLVASIIRIVLQTRANIFILDWEQPKSKRKKVSAWRRIMVANEFNRIVSIRSYSLNFTLVLLLFVLEGFNLDLLSSPVPRTELIDVGKTYKVLHFGFTSFIWILLMVIEYGLNLVIWKIIGNPYLNFIDLCATSNCSILIMSTQSQGYYLHGRSVHDHTDVDMAKLNENMASESNGDVGLRGLVANTENQVFHVYLKDDFSYMLNEIYSGILQSFTRKAIEKSKSQNAKSRAEVEAMAAFDSLNKYLCRFFDGSSPEEGPDAPLHTYTVQASTFAENFLGSGPQIGESSILTIQGDYSYRESMLIGIEWTLNVMYLLLFAGIEMETKSPSIAAFIVFVVDMLFLSLFRRKSRLNLARKAIIDRHYLVS
ncbi:hypothetical protein TRFO_06949 [Tritrichomonas foetus]|uniref:Meckelin n=1 Tax=Tritrichomonas foetus TaxID=1144522 RepID=A0A1J4JZH2_9EUKA|nr:hypothetical protein TRFO_06949 [Tritrichomonas foetus]|eukprot:OHT02894.1 hypothetical protein TRFO_06949 [Tritrichomonas foetus]